MILRSPATSIPASATAKLPATGTQPSLRGRKPEGRRRQDHTERELWRLPLALGGLAVLVVESRSAGGNATTALGIDHPPGTPGTYEVLMSGAALADHVVDSPRRPTSKCSPATIDLAGAEIELSVHRRPRSRLQQIHARLPSSGLIASTYVFLDCPPSLGLLTRQRPRGRERDPGSDPVRVLRT
mgnify:CR=1 FL=1